MEIQRLNYLIQVTSGTGANTGAKIHTFLMFPSLGKQCWISSKTFYRVGPIWNDYFWFTENL